MTTKLFFAIKDTDGDIMFDTVRDDEGGAWEEFQDHTQIAWDEGMRQGYRLVRVEVREVPNE